MNRRKFLTSTEIVASASFLDLNIEIKTNKTRRRTRNFAGKIMVKNDDKISSSLLEAIDHKELFVENNEIVKSPIWNGFYNYFE